MMNWDERDKLHTGAGNRQKVISEKRKVDEIEDISDLFIKDLNSKIKRGSSRIITKINVLKSKIMIYSLHIQKHINTIILNNTAILSNSNREPYLENACCDDGNFNTYTYFCDANSSIDVYKNKSLMIENGNHS